MTKEESYKRIKNRGILELSVDKVFSDGIPCEDELWVIGVNYTLLENCLRNIKYHIDDPLISCDIDKEYRKIASHLDQFDIDYEILTH